MGSDIEVTVNGTTERIAEGATVAGLIAHFREEDLHLIVEHNGRFVYPRMYETTVVAEGDRIEFIHPDFGG